MLPTEAFTEAVAFLRLFDLSALAVANSLCSSFALQASNKIRWEERPGLQLVLLWDRIEISRRVDASMNGDGPFYWEPVATLPFVNENELDEFVAAAFPNCIFDDVSIPLPIKHILDAVGRVADAVVIRGALGLAGSVSLNYLLNFVHKFRNVKALKLTNKVSDDQANEIAGFFRGSGVQELQYYPINDDDDDELKKLPLL